VPSLLAHRAARRAILEQHGLPIEDAAAGGLVARWHAATLAIVRYLASTLAGMFVDASAAA
jgi:hypothetical protein